MHKISIENLSFDTIIGILDFERVTPQKVIITFECEYKMGDNFINYVDIRDIIKNSMIQSQYYLIEDAISDILGIIKTKYPIIASAYIKISKPNILDDCIVSVSKTIA